MPAITAFRSVVDADTLGLNLDHPDWRVVDCRHDLSQPESGLQAYLRGHLRGAVYAHLDRDLSGPKTGRNGRHPLPSAEQLAQRFVQWGIDPQTQIVAYDAGNGQFAGRLWWLARWMGHERVALLDGGWQAALRAGIAVDAESPNHRPGRFSGSGGAMPIVSAPAVDEIRGQAGWLLVDARSPERYEGKNETVDPVAGHIPGAVNRFWQENLQDDGRFKSAEQLRAEYLALLQRRDPSKLVAQCGSGVTACHHLVAMERAGLPGASLYPGSWSEWVSDPAHAIAVGPAIG